MGFYESISAYYDLIFPVDPQTLRFLAERTDPKSRILDLACGTGSYSLALAALGRRVTGVDLDAAMIREARRKGGRQAEFQVMDMQDIGRLLQPEFDLVFCIGNSIVHLSGEAGIARVLQGCHRLMAPGGTLVVQIINYDRILEKRIMELPTLRNEAPALRFVRRYDYDDQSKAVQFRTELTVEGPEGPQVIANSVPLWILRRAVLERLAAEAGFRDLELYGGFDGQPYSLESLPLVLSGKKG